MNKQEREQRLKERSHAVTGSLTQTRCPSLMTEQRPESPTTPLYTIPSRTRGLDKLLNKARPFGCRTASLQMTGLSGSFYEASLDDKLEQLIPYEKMMGLGNEQSCFQKKRGGFNFHHFECQYFSIIFAVVVNEFVYESLISKFSRKF